MDSKYPTASEEKISLGPVWAINPRYVARIEIHVYDGIDDASHYLDVYGVGGQMLSSELEFAAWCFETADKFKTANPEIIVERKGYQENAA